MMPATDAVSFDDLTRAAGRLRGTIVRTPLLSVDDAPELTLKPENLQHVGSFKIRGATNTIAALDEQTRRIGVVAYSSGNHAQAVAAAAGDAGVPALIVVDDSAPTLKIQRTRSFGAEVVTVPPAEREATARAYAQERGAAIIPPFDHPDVIAGQGTAGVEIAEEDPDVATVLVPVSGGGLASGVGIAMRRLAPRARVIGVEPELAGDTREGWHAGHRVDWPPEDRGRTCADGLRAQPSELTFSLLREVLDDVVTVSEEEIAQALAAIARRARVVAEPSGAVGVAAYLRYGESMRLGRSVAVVSGGNVDPASFAEILQRYPAGT
jgi:threonine dehydratase